ncbi:hypothetical protein HSBAA_08070 [Vreelandella sulfidaeris]|uniref:Branched-chain amino acid aminotransferase n=1 Tax=Vreelandella sulfidaeris TaxID=115553 RepID=A0A455U4S5_9GAMM|nr:hypothetical protein HSBAA_08070 [Halomonas sulfidaeris]
MLAQDHAWVPTPASAADECSLYLRPFMIASEAFLGVRPSQEVDYYVIASPAAAYFKGGIAPVSIWLSSNYKRAAAGGTGFAKCGGNYAASLAAQKRPRLTSVVRSPSLMLLKTSGSKSSAV